MPVKVQKVIGIMNKSKQMKLESRINCIFSHICKLGILAINLTSIWDMLLISAKLSNVQKIWTNVGNGRMVNHGLMIRKQNSLALINYVGFSVK